MIKRFLTVCLAGTLASNLLLHASEVQGAARTVVYSFQGGPDGVYPSYALTNVNGKLYGTTQYGGGGTCEDETYVGCGTVFSLDPATGSETVVYSFQNYDADGSNPNAPLLARQGKLYGTTLLGLNGKCCGTIFRIDVATGAEKTLYALDAIHGTEGCRLKGGLIGVGATLYGTASYCGVLGGGTVFNFTPKTKSLSVLYSFCTQWMTCPDGGAPGGDLVYDGKRFYGTGIIGGGNNAGEIFAVDADTHKESVVYHFCGVQNCQDGAYPNPGLTYLSGLWYGTTQSGGAHNYGTLFSIDLSTGVVNIVHAFSGGTNDGAMPSSGLLRVGHKLFGTTSLGGGGGDDCQRQGGCGAVFSINPETGEEKLLSTFCHLLFCYDGRDPDGPLIDVNGMLYGSTAFGGTGTCNLYYPGCGTVYSIKP